MSMQQKVKVVFDTTKGRLTATVRNSGCADDNALRGRAAIAKSNPGIHFIGFVAII